MNEYIQAHL